MPRSCHAADIALSPLLIIARCRHATLLFIFFAPPLFSTIFSFRLSLSPAIDAAAFADGCAMPFFDYFHATPLRAFRFRRFILSLLFSAADIIFFRCFLYMLISMPLRDAAVFRHAFMPLIIIAFAADAVCCRHICCCQRRESADCHYAILIRFAITMFVIAALPLLPCFIIADLRHCCRYLPMICRSIFASLLLPFHPRHCHCFSPSSSPLII